MPKPPSIIFNPSFKLIKDSLVKIARTSRTDEKIPVVVS
jgi:hypothetical protein